MHVIERITANTAAGAGRPVVVPPVLLARLRAAGISKPEGVGDKLSAEQFTSLLAAQYDPGERIFVRNACAQCGIAPADQQG